MRESNSKNDEEPIIMVRPTLIVGLGGTGVLICRWVEQCIRELLGFVPPFIRFLKLDTDAPEEGGPPESSLSDFFNLFYDMDVGEVVRDYAARPELHPHLSWVKGFTLDASFADYGCQGIPRLGRLVFVELRERVIHKAVAARFSDLRASTERIGKGELARFHVAPGGAPAVHIASSVCGGTGAGMLVDMAYNLRWWSRESFSRDAEIIGHLMLPEAFTVDRMVRPKLEAVAGATLEQLEFLSDPRREDVPICYRYQREGEDRFRRWTAPFNLIYLLNGHGDTGSGNRTHLARMVARVIRAMTVEPLAQHVRSDANNELNNILGLRDPANGRRQCFASYGFWCGTPGHRQADVARWIRQALAEMGSDTRGDGTALATAIESKLKEALPAFDSIAGRMKGPADRFEWKKSHEKTEVQIQADVLRVLEEYLSDEGKVVQAARDQAREKLSPSRVNASLLETAKNMIVRDTLGRKKTGPFAQVGVCLDQWIHEVDQWIRQEEANEEASHEAVIQRLVKHADEQELKTLAEKQLPSHWQPDPLPDEPEDLYVNPVIRKVITQHWPNLLEAFLRENHLERVKRSLKVLRLWKSALESVSSLAKRGRLPGMDDDSSDEDRKWDDAFSSPLYAVPDPDAGGDGKNLPEDFRNTLIAPIVRDAVFSLTQSDEDAGEIEAYVDSEMKKVIPGLRDKMRGCLEEARKKKSDTFHTRVAENEAITRQEYYEPVREIVRLAAPKIDLSRTEVFAQTMEVGISQHVDGTCVPQLLSDEHSCSFRVSTVTPAYEEKQREWLELLRLRYGFCLEAISTYKNYIDAATEYADRRGFRYAEVWLDRRWYTDYRAALLQWQQDGREHKKATEVDRMTYDTIAAKIGTVRSLSQRSFELQRKAVRSMGDVEQAIRATERRKEAELELGNMLDSLSPSKPEAVRTGLEACSVRLRRVIDELYATVKGLPGPSRRELEPAVAELLAELTGLITEGTPAEQDHDTGAARIEQVRRLGRTTLDCLRKVIGSIGDIEKAAQAASMSRETELELEKRLADLSASQPDVGRKRLDDCLSPLASLIARLEAMLEGLPDQTRKELEPSVGECRTELMGVITGGPSADAERDAEAARIEQVRSLSRKTLDCVRRATESISDSEKKAQAESSCREVELEFDKALDALAASQPDLGRKRLGDCLFPLASLIARSGAMLKELPDPVRRQLEPAVAQCRDELMGLMGGGASTDEERDSST